jgi:carboxylesterase type B
MVDLCNVEKNDHHNPKFYYSIVTIYSYSLTLNINTPAIPEDPEDPSQLYPVVVFFHGGGSDSIWGSAFTALRMLEHKVVLVTLNYR